MPNHITHCDQLPTRRLRDICRGYDEDGLPVLTREKCDRYRAMWNLPPLESYPAGTPANPRSAQVAANFACLHRGTEIRKEQCTVCGGRHSTVAVHACDLHGECTIFSHGLREKSGRRKLAVCISCHDLTAPPEPIPEHPALTYLEG